MKFLHIRWLARIRMILENRSDPEYARTFADLYWRILLSIAVIAIIGVVAYSASTFFGINSQLNPTASSSPTAPLPVTVNLSRTALESTLSVFAARQAKFQTLQQNPVPPIADPSQ